MATYMHELFCDAPGCTHGLVTGHALHRTSPKGEPFRGRCTPCMYPDLVDDVAAAIEDRNLEIRAAQQN